MVDWNNVDCFVTSVNRHRVRAPILQCCVLLRIGPPVWKSVVNWAYWKRKMCQYRRKCADLKRSWNTNSVDWYMNSWTVDFGTATRARVLGQKCGAKDINAVYVYPLSRRPRRACILVSCAKFTRVGTLIVATIYLQLIQNRYMFRKFYCPSV